MSDTAGPATLLSPMVRPGHRVRMVSPASFPDAAWVTESIGILEGWDLETFRGMGLGLVDRQLTQIIRSGVLDHIAGIALGLFTEFDGYTDRGWNVLDVLRDRLGTLGVPVLGGIKAGHGGVGADGGPDQFALTIGATAVLDADAATLTVGPCVR